MRTLFIIPLVLLSLVSFPSWGLSMGDLVDRHGVYYKKFNDVLFTGEIDEGLKRGSFKNGLKQGMWISRHKDGTLSKLGLYKNGKKEGLWESYHDGLWDRQLEFKGNFKNGKKEGFWEWYTVHGDINRFLTGTFKNGVKVSD